MGGCVQSGFGYQYCMITEPVWRPVKSHPLGFLTGLSENFEKMEKRNPFWLANVRHGSELFIASDYSGQKHAYQSLSFVFLAVPGNELWDSARADFRKRWLPDGREIKYSALNENSFQLRALPAFLAAADSIRGLSITFLLDRKIKSVVADHEIARLKDSSPEFAGWEIEPFEKLFRVICLLGFLVSGLSRAGQNIWWVTDQDEIVANNDRLKVVTRCFAAITSGYLTHQLGSLRCGTNELDERTGITRDLTSIADLVAGALAEAWHVGSKEKSLPSRGQASRLSKQVVPKAQQILRWLCDKDQPLKRLVCVLEARTGSTDQVLDVFWPEFRSD